MDIRVSTVQQEELRKGEATYLVVPSCASGKRHQEGRSGHPPTANSAVLQMFSLGVF